MSPKMYFLFIPVILVFGLLIAKEGRAVGSTDANVITFSLLDHSGQPVTEKNYRGYYLLIFFGYSHCPDICPISLQIVANALEKLGDQSPLVQPLFVTLDPERDTPALLSNFVAYFHPRLIGLTGSTSQIELVAKKFFVRYQRYPSATTIIEKTGLQSQEYLLDHTGAIYLLGPKAEGLSLFPDGTPASTIADTIKELAR